ncbi:uncharacterized protein LOC119270734 [Triticum dicoccoides]|uniref:uncharacterized protein LOC119270734 n=1 Tax=Triticum dicoccoides TaxID=85692 RepID=UPI00188ED19C|nr:uncharacterized protein LOC119270734 [Triticum dicoccoides]
MAPLPLPPHLPWPRPPRRVSSLHRQSRKPPPCSRARRRLSIRPAEADARCSAPPSLPLLHQLQALDSVLSRRSSSSIAGRGAAFLAPLLQDAAPPAPTLTLALLLLVKVHTRPGGQGVSSTTSDVFSQIQKVEFSFLIGTVRSAKVYRDLNYETCSCLSVKVRVVLQLFT